MGAWTDAVAAAVRRMAAKSRDGNFMRQDLIDQELPTIVANVGSEGATPEQTLSRELQQLRVSGVILFVDDQGTYRLSS